MLRVIVDINAPECAAQATKEILAMELEKIGISKVVSVEPLEPPSTAARPHNEE